MKWNTILMVLICALIAFGGTFTCRFSDDDDDDDEIIVTQPQP